jgi:hypothetical protein
VDVQRWLETAIADALKRGLSDLRPMLESLAEATRQLRRAPWNERADRDS